MEEQLQKPIIKLTPSQQVNISSESTKSKLPIILIIIILMVLVGLGGVVVGRVYLDYSQTALLQPSIAPQPIFIPSPTASSVPTDLAKIMDRKSTNLDTLSWIEFSDLSGYKFKYPSTWFLNTNNGSVNQIQNWDPKKVKNPGIPLSGDMSKWDVNFTFENFTTIDDVLKNESEGVRVDKIEKSKTKNNEPVIFIKGTAAFFGNEERRVPIISATVINDNLFFTWHSIYSGSENSAEILYQIVESLQK